jgi:hypothetical protein
LHTIIVDTDKLNIFAQLEAAQIKIRKLRMKIPDVKFYPHMNSYISYISNSLEELKIFNDTSTNITDYKLEMRKHYDFYLPHLRILHLTGLPEITLKEYIKG